MSHSAPSIWVKRTTPAQRLNSSARSSWTRNRPLVIPPRKSLLVARDFKAADEAYKKSADLSPIRSAIRLRYVDFKIQNGATADATKIVEEIARQAPDFLPTRVYLMKVACAERRRTEDCAARVQNILTQNPVNYDALSLSGLLSLEKGEAQQAARTFNQLASIYDKDAKAKYQLAVAYFLAAKNAGVTESQSREPSSGRQSQPGFSA